MKSVLEDLARTGVAPETGADIAYDTVGALRDRVLAGERPDVLVLSEPAWEAVASTTGLTPIEALVLGRTGAALAGPAGSPLAAMDTAEQFADVLLAAPSIGYADPARGATAGALFVASLDRLGLSERLRPRLRTYPFGVDAVSAVASGEIAVAVSQATEILPRSDVALLGLFPAPFQVWTDYRAVALSAHPGARDVMRALASRAGAAALRRAGFF